VLSLVRIASQACASFVTLIIKTTAYIFRCDCVALSQQKLTKKSEKFNWTAEQQNSFQLLKRKTDYRAVNYLDFQREFLVTTDAYDYAIGAVLSQGPINQDRYIRQQNFMHGRTKL